MERRNSELSLSYNFGYKDFKGNRTHETAHYLLTDGSTHTIERNDLLLVAGILIMACN